MEGKYNCPFNFQMVTASSLISAQDYQREISGAHVTELVQNFDKYQAHPILASRRAGKLYVYDGQHTLAAFMKKFGNDVVVPVLIVDGLSEQDEAKLFRHQCDFNKKLTVKNVLNAGFVANENDVIAYCDVLKSCGFEFEFSKTDRAQNRDGVLANHAYTFNQIFRKKNKGAAQLKNVLTIISSAWGKRAKAMDVEVLKGIDVFTTIYKGEYEMARLISSLQNVNPGAIKKNATESMAKGSLKYAEAVWMIYNNRLSKEKKLPNRLH